MAKPYLSVVIPARNEAERISDMLFDVDKYLSQVEYSYEIIVVNDGSKDNTAIVVDKLISVIKNLRLIDNIENKGKGGATKQGMLDARGEFRIFLDADNAISIDQIENFWPYLKNGYDIVIGSIELKGSRAEQTAAWYRQILGKISKYIVRILAIWEIHDTQRAFKLFPAHVAERVFSRQTINRWGFDIEILIIAKKLGYKIKEIPVSWINPGGGTLRLKDYLNTFKELLKIKWNLWRGKYNLNRIINKSNNSNI